MRRKLALLAMAATIGALSPAAQLSAGEHYCDDEYMILRLGQRAE